MNVNPRCACLPLLFLLAGCAEYSPRPLHPAAWLPRFQKRSLRAPAVTAFVASQHLRLPKAFPQDWNLPALVAAGWYYRPELRQLRAQLAVAWAGLITAGERPNPSVGFSPAYAFKSPPGTNPWVLGFNFNVPIETAGRRQARLAVARAQIQRVAYQVGQAAWDIRSQIRQAWVNYWFSLHRLTLWRRQERLDRGNERIIQARFQGGRIARPLLTAAQVALEQAILARVRQQGQVKVRRAELAAALALPVAALRTVRLLWPRWDYLPGMRALSVGRLQRWALLNRMDVRALLAAYVAAEANLKLQIARQYPNINLGPGYEFDQGANKFIFGFSAALPIFNQNQGPIAQAQAQRLLAARRFESLQTKVLNQTQVAWASYCSAWRQMRRSRRLIASQKRQVAAALAGLAAGERSRLNLVEARQELVLLQLHQLAALENAQLALGLLEDALQRPLAQPHDQPNPARFLHRFTAAAK